MPLPTMNNNRRQQHQRYDTISSTDEDDDDAQRQQPPSPAAADAATATAAAAEQTEQMMNITILDFCHTRFPMSIPITAKVGELKKLGVNHHNVHVNQQRLIYQGKLLSDENATLASIGIKPNSIIHLFPKPRVVVVNGDEDDDDEEDGISRDEDNDNGATDANIPTIRLDRNEVERRNQILVLGSMEYSEAVNNVKLFSFMLLMISSIELLNLLAVSMGGTDANNNNNNHSSDGFLPPAYQEDDDYFPNDDDVYNNSTNSTSGGGGPGSNIDAENVYETTWTNWSWLDVIVSCLGVYVALLGIRASTENAVVLAKLYYYGICITAFGWILYNFVMTIQIDEKVADEMEYGNGSGSNSNNHGNDNLNEQDIYNQAFQVMILPSLVWMLCIFRAWQFQHLLVEAEQEAAERILAEEQQNMGLNNTNDEVDDDDEEDELVATIQAEMT